jgi:hypothetical protein
VKRAGRMRIDGAVVIDELVPVGAIGSTANDANG